MINCKTDSDKIKWRRWKKHFGTGVSFLHCYFTAGTSRESELFDNESYRKKGQIIFCRRSCGRMLSSRPWYSLLISLSRQVIAQHTEELTISIEETYVNSCRLWILFPDAWRKYRHKRHCWSGYFCTWIDKGFGVTEELTRAVDLLNRYINKSTGAGLEQSGGKGNIWGPCSD